MPSTKNPSHRDADSRENPPVKSSGFPDFENDEYLAPLNPSDVKKHNFTPSGSAVPSSGSADLGTPLPKQGLPDFTDPDTAVPPSKNPDPSFPDRIQSPPAPGAQPSKPDTTPSPSGGPQDPPPETGRKSHGKGKRRKKFTFFDFGKGFGKGKGKKDPRPLGEETSGKEEPDPQSAGALTESGQSPAQSLREAEAGSFAGTPAPSFSKDSPGDPQGSDFRRDAVAGSEFSGSSPAPEAEPLSPLDPKASLSGTDPVPTASARRSSRREGLTSSPHPLSGRGFSRGPSPSKNSEAARDFWQSSPFPASKKSAAETADAQGHSARRSQRDRRARPTKLPSSLKRPPRWAVIAAAVVVGGGILGGVLWSAVLGPLWRRTQADPVSVVSVGLISGLDLNSAPKYGGIVEPQSVEEIKKDAARTIKEVFVEKGAQVRTGDPLFSYDTAEMELDLKQAQLDIDNYNQMVATLQKQITDLETQRTAAQEADKVGYTLQISLKELEIQEQQHLLSIKEQDITALNTAIANAQVNSPYDGTVKEINLSDQLTANGMPRPFLSIQTAGAPRIQGILSELNMDALTVGQPVNIISRIDPEKTWTGTVESIDFENPVGEEDNNPSIPFGFGYGTEADTAAQATKYHYYIRLNGGDQDLILGQHVFIEPIAESSISHEGLWLPAFYIQHDDDRSFVWARDENDLLTQRTVILNQYDSQSDLYEVIGGVDSADYIAFPDAHCQEGIPTLISQDVAEFDPYSPLPASDNPAPDEEGLPREDPPDYYDENGSSYDGYHPFGENDDYDEGYGNDLGGNGDQGDEPQTAPRLGGESDPSGNAPGATVPPTGTPPPIFYDENGNPVEMDPDFIVNITGGAAPEVV